MVPISALSTPHMTQQSLIGQALLIFQTLRSHSGTPHSVGLLWTSDQPDAETSTRKYTTLTRDRHAYRRQTRQASGRRLTH